MNDRFEFEVQASPLAAAVARRVLIGHLADRIDGDARDRLVLLLSEVVTNAARHSGMAEGDPIRLSVHFAAGRVRVEVADLGPGFTPAVRPATDLRGSGWGLYLVDRISARWGVEGRSPSRVWFELDAGFPPPQRRPRRRSTAASS